ncbi:M56 family metallopeptidase [Sinomicrobium weinanense]|uniref:Biopolymer transporter ExbD n=1 Tax=Sinomicrobium weinanense TaxID=2842200 RepID=A0A926JQA2_9FLAO|nr:M56 family metallopeptidase [Sinomicrobium weinanense]MBC9795333.1 biopolymer transporter ExbD [Sinomicrobium weinanense]MBU3122952.1 M56 family metallopeptidase [Sinomicrobium weinanense]
MLYYILKSSACLTVFILFYKLFLEKQDMHVFKRFYLIFALIASFCIPLITFKTYVEPALTPQLIAHTAIPAEKLLGTTIRETNYFPVVLWGIYGMGAAVFGILFLSNLLKLIKKITLNEKKRSGKFTNVLLLTEVVPHTFFHYIFLEKNKFEAGQIPEEILLHEQSHARQKHSLDLVFIELLQVIFWFNPLIYFIKKDIRLNHEFLADQAVLSHGYHTRKYQQMLLAYSLRVAHYPFAAAINYSFIKKRFTVMRTHTSKKAIWLRSLMLLPLLTVLVCSFSQKKEIEKNNSEIQSLSSKKTVSILENTEILVTKDRKLYVNGKQTTLKALPNILAQLGLKPSSDKQDKTGPVKIKIEKGVKMGLVTDIKEQLRQHGYPAVKITPLSQRKGATPKQIAEHNKLTSFYNSQPGGKRIIKFDDLARIQYLYTLMTGEQKAQAQPLATLPPPPPEAPQKPEPVSIQEDQFQLVILINKHDELMLIENSKDFIEKVSINDLKDQLLNIHKNEMKRSGSINTLIKTDRASKGIIARVSSILEELKLYKPIKMGVRTQYP